MVELEGMRGQRGRVLRDKGMRRMWCRFGVWVEGLHLRYHDTNDKGRILKLGRCPLIF